ncbi:MAG TPA: hypothetical protein DCQ50_04900 [Chryseobacterium sp.]|nr:hypothetical protein [Chryseobacterium sp.]
MVLQKPFVLAAMLLIACGGYSQTNTLKIDTSFYERYPRKLIISPFWVKTPVTYSIAAPGTERTIRYYDNSPAGLGLRVGFDWLSVSAAFRTPIVDPDYHKQRGKTSNFNLQTTFAARKLLIDVYYQKTKGTFLRSDATPPYTTSNYYIRPDIKTNLLGVTGLFVFNGKRFSSRPPFKFDAWQKKSAGSFLSGIEFLTGTASGDSALLPAAYNKMLPEQQINKMTFLLLGPSAGYGHTFVIRKHLFITAIASVNADIGRVKEYTIRQGETPYKRWRFDPNVNFRGGIGYNKRDWELALSYFTKRIFYTGQTNSRRYGINYSDYRLSYTRRIQAGKTIPKVVDWAGNIIDKLGLGFLIR